MRYNYNTTAIINRLGAYSSDKSTYAPIAGAIPGFFIPTTITNAVGQVDVVDQTYQFYTDGYNDIQQTDRLSINGKEYGVQGVARFSQLSQDILNVTLKLIVKN